MKRAARRRTRLAVALLAGALATSACGSSSGGSPAEAERSRYQFGIVGEQPEGGEPVSGGTLVVADYSEARSLDPAVTFATGDSGGNALAAVYDVLVRYNHETGEHEPWLAESLESNEDLTQWTLTLRDGVEFTDGTPLDAEAVVGSIGRYMASQGADTALLAPNIKDMRPVDDLTVVFEMNNPFASLPSMLAQASGMIVAPASYAGEEFTPIGAGPFVLESYKPQEEMVLTANRDYWKGEPPLDALRFYWPLGDEAKLAALNDGATDVSYFRSADVVDTALDEGHAGFLALSSIGSVVQINHREGRPGSDVRVRKAIALALDPQIDFNRTYGEGTTGLVGNEIFPPESRWHSEVEPLGIDVEAAKKLVEEAKADGFDGKISYLDGTDPTSRAGSVAIKALLERVGFEVEIEGVASIADQIQRIYVEQDYDLARGATSVSEADPYHRLQTSMHSESFSNALGYQDPAMDAALEELRGADTEDAIQDALDDIQTLWNETVPAVITSASATMSAWQDEVHGIVPTTERIVLFGEAWKGE